MGSTNLIVDVPVKAKKPTLYATALMTHLFSDEEMKEGCVEPREGNSSKKTPLDQAKINIIKSKSLSSFMMHHRKSGTCTSISNNCDKKCLEY